MGRNWEVPLEPDWNRKQSPVCILSAGDARSVLRSITDDDEAIWPYLQDNEWGGHYHRVLLELACSDMHDDDLINITPIYIEQRLKDLPDDVDEWKQKIEIEKACRALELDIQESVKSRGTVNAQGMYVFSANHRYDEVEPGIKRPFVLTQLATSISHLIDNKRHQ